MSKKLSKQKLAGYKEAFTLFDKNKNGTISQNELGTVMKEFGENPTKNEVNKLLKEADLDKNGRIEFKEFIRLMEMKVSKELKEKELMDSFKNFDIDGNGYITSEELKTVLAKHGQSSTQQEVEEMIRHADIDADGRVNYFEFVQMMKD